MVSLEAVEHITCIKDINSSGTKSDILRLKINLGQWHPVGV